MIVFAPEFASSEAAGKRSPQRSQSTQRNTSSEEIILKSNVHLVRISLFSAISAHSAVNPAS